MIEQQYQETANDLIETAHNIETCKRPAYTLGNPDVLHNFKSVASRANITPLQAWLVYFLKHVDAISAFAGDPDIPQAEEIKGRFADAINYLKLGYALVAEQDLLGE